MTKQYTESQLIESQLGDAVEETMDIIEDLRVNILKYLKHKKIYCNEPVQIPSGTLIVNTIDGYNGEFTTKNGETYNYADVAFELLAQLFFIAKDKSKNKTKNGKKKIVKKKPVIKNKVLNKWIKMSNI